MKHNLIGKQFGKFRITAVLAEGGALDVYKGVQAGLEREVVIQVLPPAFAADAVLADAFRRALQRAARLAHPNIVALYDSGHAHGVDYFVTEYLRGGSLEERVDAEGPLPVNRALTILSDVLKGLIYAHEKGEVHGDLRPGRIRFDHRGNAILTGFGRLESPDARARREGPVGVAPELAGGMEPTVWSDLYQVAALLYWMLSGRSAIPDASLAALESTILPATLPSLDTLNPEVNPDLAAYLARVMDPDPAGRPQDAAQMLQNLRKIDLRHRARKLCAGESLQIDAGMSKVVPGVLPSRGTPRVPRPSAGGSLDSLRSPGLSLSVPAPAPLTARLPRRTVLLKGGLTLGPPVLAALAIVLWSTLGIDLSGLQLREKVIELEARRAIVAFRSSRPCYASVEFWQRDNPQIKHRTRMGPQEKLEHEQVLPDLVPDTAYGCRVIFASSPEIEGEITLSPVFDFHTPKAPRIR